MQGPVKPISTEMIKSEAKTQNIRMPLFALLISFCVFTEYEKFNNSTTQYTSL